MTIQLRGHHLRAFQYYLHTGQILSDDYGPEFKDKVQALYTRIESEPELDIAITTTLDDICDGCPIKTKECDWYEHDDKFMAFVFNFNCGETYPAREIVSNLREARLW